MAAAHDTPTGDPARLSEIYDEAVTEVYRYLRARCGSVALAEELGRWLRDEGQDAVTAHRDVAR